jgi:hypothetical protein
MATAGGRLYGHYRQSRAVHAIAWVDATGQQTHQAARNFGPGLSERWKRKFFQADGSTCPRLTIFALRVFQIAAANRHLDRNEQLPATLRA